MFALAVVLWDQLGMENLLPACGFGVVAIDLYPLLSLGPGMVSLLVSSPSLWLLPAGTQPWCWGRAPLVRLGLWGQAVPGCSGKAGGGEGRRRWSLLGVGASPMLSASPEGHLQTPGEGARPRGVLPDSAPLLLWLRVARSSAPAHLQTSAPHARLASATPH